MNKVLRPRSLSLEDVRNETRKLQNKTASSKSKEVCKSKPIGRYMKRSNSSSGSIVVDYGPIRVRHRQTVSQTLATGRRSKDEPASGPEALKRDLRRAKNRIAARELKKSRDQIEFELIQKIKELERAKTDLQDQHKYLEARKSHLNRAVYNAKQAPLVPFITDMNIPLWFGPQERQDLLIDLRPLLLSIEEQCFVSDN